jgi:hypothetical protein
MKVNSKQIEGNTFFFDGCHKIYIIEDKQDIKDFEKKGWSKEDIYPIEELEETYYNTCSLRFISNCKLDKNYVKQCEKAIFTNI